MAQKIMTGIYWLAATTIGQILKPNTHYKERGGWSLSALKNEKPKEAEKANKAEKANQVKKANKGKNILMARKNKIGKMAKN